MTMKGTLRLCPECRGKGGYVEEDDVDVEGNLKSHFYKCLLCDGRRFVLVNKAGLKVI